MQVGPWTITTTDRCRRRPSKRLVTQWRYLKINKTARCGDVRPLAEVLEKKMLADANINPDTGLATDYLNHYNEVAMLIDMLESMPEVAEDILEWRPITYAEHFHVTGFRAKELAVQAYQQCAPMIRERFDEACAHVEDALKEVQDKLAEDQMASADIAMMAPQIYDLIAAVSGVINPQLVHGEAEEGDVWNMTEQTVAEEQAAIDALFD